MIFTSMIIGYFGGVVAALVWIVTALATWRVFVKAGEAGWKALVPGLREYTIFRIAWNSRAFWIYLAVVMAASFMEVAADRAGALTVYGIVGSVIDIAVIYYEVVVKMKLAQCFGRSRAFGLFLYFVEFLGMTSLSFGPYDYMRTEEE